jgi:hypothetical protein
VPHTIVAAGLERAYASSMLAPFVLPETLVVSIFIHPVVVHVREQIGFASRLENLCNVGVGAL